MFNILDHLAESHGPFRPETPREFFALQLARRLRDESHLRDYLILAERYPQQLLLQAFWRSADQIKANGIASERFREQLKLLIQREE